MPTTRQRDLVTFHCGGKPYSLKYKHRDLRMIVEGTKRDIVSLFDDAFAGLPYLLMAGLRHQHPRLTVDDACQLFDEWMEEGKELKDLQNKILDALTESGYLKKAEESTDGSEGKDQSPTPIQ